LNDEDNYIEGWRRAKRVLVIAVKQVVLHRGITLGFLLVAINAVTMVVLENNQNASVYPGNADSIAIPIISTWFLAFLVSPFLLLVTFLPKTLKGIDSTNSGLGTRVESIFIQVSVIYRAYVCLWVDLFIGHPQITCRLHAGFTRL